MDLFWIQRGQPDAGTTGVHLGPEPARSTVPVMSMGQVVTGVGQEPGSEGPDLQSTLRGPV